MSSFHSSGHFRSCFGAFQALRTSDALTDLTLSLGGGEERRVHRLVLAAASPYFHALFESEMRGGKGMEADATVSAEGFTESGVDLALDFIYTGKIRLQQETLRLVLPVADFWQLRELKEACCVALRRQLSTDNCVGVRDFAASYGCLDLEAAAMQFMCKHFSLVQRSADFLSLSVQSLDSILSSEFLRRAFNSEETLFHALVDWTAFDAEERRRHLPRLLSRVRLADVEVDVVVKRLEEAGFDVDEDEEEDDEDEECRRHLARVLRTQGVEWGDETERRKRRRLRLAEKKRRRRPENRNLPEIDARGRALPTRTSSSPDANAEDDDEAKMIFVVGGADADFADTTPKVLESFTGETDCIVDADNDAAWVSWRGVDTSAGVVGAAGVGKEVIVIGESRTEVWSFSPVEGEEFKELAPMTDDHPYGAVVSLNGVVYVVGGGVVVAKGVVEKLDVRCGKWSAASPLRVARSNCGAGVAADENGRNVVVVAGGWTGANGRTTPLNSCEFYDAEKDEWNIVEARLSNGRYSPGVAALGQLVFVVGGSRDGRSLREVEVLDPDFKKWVTIENMTVGRNGPGVAAVAGRVLVVGGHDGARRLSSVEAYDPFVGEWTTMTTTTRFPRWRPSIVVVVLEEEEKRLVDERVKQHRKKMVEEEEGRGENLLSYI